MYIQIDAYIYIYTGGHICIDMGVHIDTYIEQSTHDLSIVRCFDRRTHAMPQMGDNCWRCASAGTERNTVNRALKPQRPSFRLPWPNIVALPAHKHCTYTHSIRGSNAHVCVCVYASHTWKQHMVMVSETLRPPPPRGLGSYQRNKPAGICVSRINFKRRTREWMVERTLHQQKRIPLRKLWN